MSSQQVLQAYKKGKKFPSVNDFHFLHIQYVYGDTQVYFFWG